MIRLFLVLGLCLGAVESVLAQVTVRQAIQLEPVQKGDVQFSVPNPDEVENCTVSSPTQKGLRGWVVKDSAGRILRKFLDTNGDKDIDVWSYYRDGFEVYRDIDSNFDRRADQYRWLGSEGTRWGNDVDQDGKIDSWKRISAEEVSSEVAAALKNRDQARFDRLLITDKELETVGLGGEKIKLVKKNILASKAAFAKLSKAKSEALRGSSWVHFGGLRPGLIAAGTDGAKADIVIYENVAALIRSGDNDLQVILGTMVQAGDCWRMIDAPEIIDSKSSTTFASWHGNSESKMIPGGSSAPLDFRYQKLLEEFQVLDRKLLDAKSRSEKGEIYGDLSKTIAQLAIQAETVEDSLNWSRQFADTVTDALQNGDYPDGLASLQSFVTLLTDNEKSDEAIALVEYRYINAEFGVRLTDTNVNVAEAQAEWLKQLKEFTDKHPTDDNVPDAIMQLAMADEFDGQPKEAEKWYQMISVKFSESQYAAKAKGAIRRLNSIGERMTLGGRTTTGKKLELASLKGRVVLVHYWADWCEICKNEFPRLAILQKRYPGLQIVGVNCDNDLDAARKAIQQVNVAWPQFHSEGGYNQGFAAEMGIVSLPSMILVDQEGRILSTTVTASTLERELKSILQPSN
ncbi:MAG: TlpA disulfide reductase family protein [Planctomycetota bacterium]|nr:TlpA disulfide reductase family protein [Planctomycetota bacterium]